jgi:hypothetical protein
MPYLSEMPEVIRMADDTEPGQESKHYFILMASEEDLPYLVDGGYYKNLYRLRFEIPQEDKDLLTEKVKEAGKMLIEFPSVILAHHDSELNATIIQ